MKLLSTLLIGAALAASINAMARIAPESDTPALTLHLAPATTGPARIAGYPEPEGHTQAQIAAYPEPERQTQPQIARN